MLASKFNNRGRGRGRGGKNKIWWLFISFHKIMNYSSKITFLTGFFWSSSFISKLWYFWGNRPTQAPKDIDGDVGMGEKPAPVDTHKWRRNKDTFGARQMYQSGSSWVVVSIYTLPCNYCPGQRIWYLSNRCTTTCTVFGLESQLSRHNYTGQKIALKWLDSRQILKEESCFYKQKLQHKQQHSKNSLEFVISRQSCSSTLQLVTQRKVVLHQRVDCWINFVHLFSLDTTEKPNFSSESLCVFIHFVVWPIWVGSLRVESVLISTTSILWGMCSQQLDKPALM